MKQVYKNIYIETYNNFDIDIGKDLLNLNKNKIKYVINLTECDQLTVNHRIELLYNKIKSKDFFNHPDLIRIKKITPDKRTKYEINKRRILREKIVKDGSNFIYNLSLLDDNILFICNRNNVLSQLFAFIIITLRKEEYILKEIFNNKNIVTSDKNKTDIKMYLDKYLDIIYNNINEVSK